MRPVQFRSKCFCSVLYHEYSKTRTVAFLLFDKALKHWDCLKIKFPDNNEDKQSNVTDELFDLDWSWTVSCEGLCSVFSGIEINPCKRQLFILFDSVVSCLSIVMESLLKNIKKQVTCSICLDTYTEPKIISCFHTFCCECLEKHARVSQKEGKFRCPECQAAIDLPEGNRFDRLTNSFFHKSLLSLLAIRQSGDACSITCSQCRKPNPQMYYCFDCGRFMCLDCFNAHQLLSATFEGHKVTPVKDFKVEDYEAVLKRQPFCSQEFHEREVTRFFCLECQVCICQICIVTDHQNHKVVLLDKAALEEKDNIMCGAKLIRNKESELCEVVKQFEETISKLESNLSTAKREVSRVAEEIIAETREREREVIDSVEATRVSMLERINSAKQEVETLIKQMKQAAEFAENLVQKSSSADVMQNKETLKQKFEELRGVEVPKHQQTTFVKFSAAPRLVDWKLGVIEVTPTADAKRSRLEGLDQRFQADVEAELTLCAQTSEGETINQGDLKDQVEFLIEPAKDVTNVFVNKRENSGLQLKFTPKLPGSYSIEVRINGDKLPTCPYTLNVKERELVIVGEMHLKLFPVDTLQFLSGIAVNKKGEVAVVDDDGHCVYVFDKDGNCVRKIGSQGKEPGQFEEPTGVSYLNDKEILVADYGNDRIQQIDIQTGTVVKSFGKCGSRKGDFGGPHDVCLDDVERIIVTDWYNHRIQVMSKEGESIFTFGDRGPEKLSCPTSCIPYKNMFLLCDEGNGCIKAFDQSGTFLYKFGKEGNQDGELVRPNFMLVDSSDNLLVCDSDNNRVQQFFLDGRFTGKSTTHLPCPRGIVAAPDGRILVTSGPDNKVFILK